MTTGGLIRVRLPIATLGPPLGSSVGLVVLWLGVAAGIPPIGSCVVGLAGAFEAELTEQPIAAIDDKEFRRAPSDPKGDYDQN